MILEHAINLLAMTATVLCAKKIIWCWPIWIVTAMCWFVLFYQQKLWTMFDWEWTWLFLNIYGWYEWKKR